MSDTNGKSEVLLCLLSFLGSFFRCSTLASPSTFREVLGKKIKPFLHRQVPFASAHLPYVIFEGMKYMALFLVWNKLTLPNNTQIIKLPNSHSLILT